MVFQKNYSNQKGSR